MILSDAIVVERQIKNGEVALLGIVVHIMLVLCFTGSALLVHYIEAKDGHYIAPCGILDCPNVFVCEII